MAAMIFCSDFKAKLESFCKLMQQQGGVELRRSWEKFVLMGLLSEFYDFSLVSRLWLFLSPNNFSRRSLEFI